MAEDGNGRKVGVGAGVFVGVSVGGGGVAVGMAAWVSAITVNASAAAVPCISTALIVGVDCTPRAPQALMLSDIISTRVRLEKDFM